MTEEYEEIDKPAHYGFELDGRRWQAIDVIEALGLGFNEGNALKYLVRAGSKPGVNAEADLRKAAWYLLREADRMVASIRTERVASRPACEMIGIDKLPGERLRVLRSPGERTVQTAPPWPKAARGWPTPESGAQTLPDERYVDTP